MRIFTFIKYLFSIFRFNRKKRELEKEQERIQESIRQAVRLTQHSEFITREDLEKIREENMKHDFTKSR